MDKNIIKKHLNSKFISEETVPGISVTAAVNKESGKFNKDGVKAIEKDVTAFEKNIKADKNEKEMAQNKFNYDDDFEKTYHDEMEIMNGQEMLQYDSKPDDNFKKRAEEAIEGSTRMGNNPEWANVIPKQQGFTGPDFGKNLIKRVKASTDKRNKQTPTLNLRGANIQADLKDTGHRPYALDENIETTEEKNARIISGWIAETGVDKVAEKLLNRYSETGMLSDMPDSMEYGNAINKIISLLNKKQFTLAMQTAKKSATKLDKKAMKGGMFENNYNNKTQIKEGMKRLKFKKEFNGVGNALKMIPESYRVDNKQFEMTDGNETYKIRWEGNLTEGRAVVLMASDKKMVSEDMAHMKHLMGYKSTETLGLLKGNARINENAVFGDIYNKSKMLLEGEDIENAKAKTGEWDGITKKAPEATKHVQGSVSKDKGTQAPSAKEGDLDDAVSHAPEAKAHVEGSVSTEKGTKAPAAKTGNWDDVKKKSADATKHVTLKESEEKEEEEETEEDVTIEEVEETKEVKTEGSDIEGTKASKIAAWEDHDVTHAPEAKKHIHMGTESKANLETEAKEMNEGITLGGIRFEPINESMYEGMYEEGIFFNRKAKNELNPELELAMKELELAKNDIKLKDLLNADSGDGFTGPDGFTHIPKEFTNNLMGYVKEKYPSLVKSFWKYIEYMGHGTSAGPIFTFIEKSISKPINEGMYEEGMYEEYYVAIAAIDEPGEANAQIVSSHDVHEYEQNGWDLRGPFSEEEASNYLDKINQSNRDFRYYDSMDDREGKSNLYIDPLDKFERDGLEPNW